VNYAVFGVRCGGPHRGRRPTTSTGVRSLRSCLASRSSTGAPASQASVTWILATSPRSGRERWRAPGGDLSRLALRAALETTRVNGCKPVRRGRRRVRRWWSGATGASRFG